MDSPAPVSKREQSWFGPIVALLLLGLVPLVPLLRVVVPIERTVFLVVPALAVCSLVGWWFGGRILLAVAWVALAAWTLTASDASAAPHFDRMQRGWSLLLAACFGVVSIVVPHRVFLTRALASIGIALVIATGAVIVAGGDGREVIDAVTAEFVGRNEQFSQNYEQQLRENASFRKLVEENAMLASLATDAVKSLGELAINAGKVFPALLALQSLAVLALAWALFHRLSRTRIGEPLGAIKDFRFDDKLIWGLLLGLTFLIPQGQQDLNTAGWMLVVFFGGLYAARGLGVVAWLLAPRRKWLTAITILLTLVLPQYALAVLLGLGVGDTWADWRNRPKPAT